MRIVPIVGGILIIAAFAVLGYGSYPYSPGSWPSVEKSYSLEWLPPDAPRDINCFQIDTDKEVIRYLYFEKQNFKTVVLTHPLEVNNAGVYNVENLSIQGYFLVVSLVKSGWMIYATISLIALFIGISALIVGTQE